MRNHEVVNRERMPVLCAEENHNEYGSTWKNESRHDRSKDIFCHTCDIESSSADGSYQDPHESLDGLVTQTTLTRFWILFVFSAISWVHCLLWNTWGPINESVEAAFPSWDSSTVAMTVNWTTIMYMIFVLPMCFVIQKCGFRNVMIMSSALIFLGASIRCATDTIPWFTILCQLCNILLGIASTIILAGPSLIASDWFPLNERTTAVAVMMGASQLGQLGSYLEPLLVEEPGHGASIKVIKEEISKLLYIGAGASCLLFVAVLAYFPSKPKIPPSLTSATRRLDIWSGILSLIKNKNFLLVVLAYGVSVGPPIGWIPVLNYSLQSLGFHQGQAMWLGLTSIIVSSFFPIFYGHIMDRFPQHMRTNLVVLMLLAAACFYWFLLISYGVIPVSKWQVYMSVVGGLTLNYTTIPLFYELVVEIAYPVPEILIAGILTGADNLFSTLFLFIFLIPDVGYIWVTGTLVICSSFTILPLLAAKVDYSRTKMDLSDT